MKKFIFLTNIPTPYRNSFYNDLAKDNFIFKVFYMRKIEDDRSWVIDLNEMKYDYYIDRGLYKMFGRFHFHFNPNLIYKILKEKQIELIVGGGWNDIDVLILVLLKRLGLIKIVMHFWTEANYLTLGASNDNFIKKNMRRFIYSSTSGAQLSSGKMTELTLEKWGVKTNKFISLPNTIEEEIFIVLQSDIELRRLNKLPIILIPARLHEQVKGILNFLIGINIENIRKCKFMIAGDGPDKDLILEFINENSLQNNVILLGHCNSKELVDLYKSANLFVLPSFTDASPLTVIEALRMKLPLLISERCGNHYEAVKNGKNGYIFNPYSSYSIKKSFEKIFNQLDSWEEMGNISSEIYDLKFNKSKVIKTFVKTLSDFTISK